MARLRRQKKREARRRKEEKDAHAAAERSAEIQAQWGVAVTPSMRLYLPRVEARLRGIIALKAYVAS